MKTVNYTQLLQDIMVALNQFVDEERKAFAKLSYPTSLEILGLKNAHLQQVRKELLKSTQHLLATEKMELGKLMLQQGIMELHQLAYEFVGSDRKTLAIFTEEDIPSFTQGMDNWAAVDTLACYVLGVAWRNQQVSDACITNLAKHKNVWHRRLALASTVPLNLSSRGGKGDAKRTLMVCGLLVSDKEDMVVKALSWALRLLIKHERELVIDFINTHEKVLAKRVIREVNNKLDTGLKNPK